MMIELDSSINEDQRRALMYALKRAIETVYQLESSELAVEPLPGHTGDHAWSRLLFFEAAEGGAGVLRRVATEDGQLRVVARKALELLHFDPDTGRGPAPGGIRPRGLRPGLLRLPAVVLQPMGPPTPGSPHRHRIAATPDASAHRTPPDEQTPDDRYQNLAAASNSLERQFLDCPQDTTAIGCPMRRNRLSTATTCAPTSPTTLAEIDVAVFLDGPIHDGEYQKQKDEQAAPSSKTSSAGWCCDSTTPTLMKAGSPRSPPIRMCSAPERLAHDRTHLPAGHAGARTRTRLAGYSRRHRRHASCPPAWVAATPKRLCCLPEFDDPTPAVFAPPTVDDRGDASRARLLRDGLRLSFQATGGPFRSFAKLAVTPRNYQLVPLMMATAQDTTRLLIADGVGIGKTVEAGLIMAELLATGDAERLAVLCSPQLAPQWRAELQTKFGIDAQLLLPSTVNRLQRGVPFGSSDLPALPVPGDLHRLHQAAQPPRRVRRPLPRTGDRR